MNRRDFSKIVIGAGLGYGTISHVFAELLELTPSQVEGPFFPDKLPLDTDNDLIYLNDSVTASIGEVSHLSGKITDVRGTPIPNAVIEIWQVDGNGAYIHTEDPRLAQGDKHFQGYGRFLTNRKGEYYFRTIKPVSYPGRVPHIHVKVSQKNKDLLTTQIYLAGNKANENDVLYSRAGGKRSLLEVDFKPIPESKAGELMAEFNIILGVTPSDSE